MLIEHIKGGGRKLGGTGAVKVLRDLVGIAGAGLISYGAWLVYVPAGYAVGGLLLLIGAFLAAVDEP